MATEIQKNLVEKNAEYARTFDKGDLALPPAKKYLIRKGKKKKYPQHSFLPFSPCSTRESVQDRSCALIAFYL